MRFGESTCRKKITPAMAVGSRRQMSSAGGSARALSSKGPPAGRICNKRSTKAFAQPHEPQCIFSEMIFSSFAPNPKSYRNSPVPRRRRGRGLCSAWDSSEGELERKEGDYGTGCHTRPIQGSRPCRLASFDSSLRFSRPIYIKYI